MNEENELSQYICFYCRSIMILPVTIPSGHYMCFDCVLKCEETVHLLCDSCRFQQREGPIKSNDVLNLIDWPKWESIKSKFSSLLTIKNNKYHWNQNMSDKTTQTSGGLTPSPSVQTIVLDHSNEREEVIIVDEIKDESILNDCDQVRVIPFVCNFEGCSETFDLLSNLNSHKKTHSNPGVIEELVDISEEEVDPGYSDIATVEHFIYEKESTRYVTKNKFRSIIKTKMNKDNWYLCFNTDPVCSFKTRVRKEYEEHVCSAKLFTINCLLCADRPQFTRFYNLKRHYDRFHLQSDKLSRKK